MSGQLSREDIRDVFNSRFSYSDIGASDIMALEGFLGIELALYRETTDYGRDMGMTISHHKKDKPKVSFRDDEPDRLESAFLRCDGAYFHGREAISFNSDGFIGFCGWADSKNTAPFLRAFSRWMGEWLSEKGALIE